MKKGLLITALLLVCIWFSAAAQKSSSEEISAKLEIKDSLLFDAAFNTCNLNDVELVLSKDFVFYHDGGYGERTTSQSKKDFVGDIQKNICSNKNMKMKREIVKGSLQVFLKDDNNAIQTGMQRIYVVLSNGADKIAEESKFTRDWKKINGDWKMTRELDYAVNSKFNNETSSPLYKEIFHMDSVLFNAFNSHDLEKLKFLFSEDLEFYHDKGGLTNYTQNMQAFKEMALQTHDLKRELVSGSLEVYPINNYGAVEIGVHRFCHVENGKDVCGSFKFVHVWKKTNDGWKLARVVSYDH
ncbi:MAG TPA: nuclear transport factor 2 family protein [Puia sp.]|nr:nuclear transport factor 2 family protein [Puia sp.]